MNLFKYLIFVLFYCFLLKQACVNTEYFIILFVVFSAFALHSLSLQKKVYLFGKELKESMDMQREHFVNSLNHDLRIPVLAQLRALELIQMEQLGTLNHAQKDILNQTVQSGRCILNLISLLINIYRIENNVLNVGYQRFNVHELVIYCFNELKDEAAEKNLTYSLECSNKNLYINANKDEIKKLLINLLLATIMYSNYGSKVLVKVVQTDNKLRVSVSCDGSNAYSLNMNLNSRYTSIGESIRIHFCKKVIETHKGQIIKPKMGDAFVFELPMAAV